MRSALKAYEQLQFMEDSDEAFLSCASSMVNALMSISGR